MNRFANAIIITPVVVRRISASQILDFIKRGLNPKDHQPVYR